MATITPIPGNADPVVVLSATGAGAGAITFLHNTGGEGGKPAQLFPASFIFAITDIVGTFSALQINLEWSPITSTDPPQFETIGTWNALASPTVFFPCSSTGQYRLNCTSFTGGTSFNIYASIASSMPQGSGGGGGGGSVTQGTVPWIDNIAQVAGVALGATGVVAYGSTPAAVNVPGVNAFITNAGSIGGGTQFADNAASGATPTGVLSMGWDSANSKIRALKVDATQNLLVDISNASIAVTGTFFQATQPVSIASTVIVAGAKTPTDSYTNPIDAEDSFALLGGWDATNSKWQRVQVDAATGTLKVDPGTVAVTGTFFQGTQPVSIAAAIDVSDRAARLVGVVYGSQAQQLKQTATNFNLQVELATDGTLYDARSIRALTSADVVTVSNTSVQFADNTASGVTPTGTLSMAWDVSNSKIRAIQMDTNQRLLINPVVGNSAPTAAQPIFARTAMDVNILSVHDTAVPAAAALADNIANPTTAMFGVNTLGWDATNSVWRRLQVVAGTGDLFHAITDGSNGPAAVKPPSTAAIATDAALVVALSPNNPVSVSFPAVQVVQGIAGGTPEPTTESSPMKDILVQMLLALDAINMNLGQIMSGSPVSRQELARSEF